MPRTYTAGQRNTVKAASYNLHWKVEVQSAAGVWQDFGNLGALDWTDKANWSDSIDNPVMEGSVSFLRESGVLSLAPLMSGATNTINWPAGSYTPALEGGRPVRISIAYPAVGVAPISSDYIEVFLGVLSSPSWGGRDSNTLSATIRDIGTLLMSKWTHGEVVYGSNAGTALEVCMQSILNDNIEAKLKQFSTGSNGIDATTGAVTLAFPSGGSGVMMNKFTFPVGPVLVGLRDLASQVGWDVRFRYDASNNFALTLFNPPRSKTTPDDTFDGNEYFSVPMFGIPDDDVRNNLDLYFTNKATGAVAFVNKQNAASIAKYGERYHRITTGATSPINSVALATALANAIDSDLALPYSTQDVETNLAWFIQTTDLYQFAANGRLYDTSQNLGIIGYDHTLSGHDGTTVMHCRAQVAGLYKNWLQQASVVSGAVPSILNLTWVDAATQQTFSGKFGSNTTAVWVYEQVMGQGGIDAYAAGTALPIAYLNTTPFTYVAGKPTVGMEKRLYFEPRDANLIGGATQRHIIYGIPVAPYTVTPTESGATGTLSVTVADPTYTLDAALRVSWAITVLGVRTLYAVNGTGAGVTTSGPTTGPTNGTYAITFPLVQDHTVKVEPIIHLSDGTTVMPGGESFDPDRVADVLNVDVTPLGVVTATFDTDTASGAAAVLPAIGPAQYSLDNGATWVNVTVTNRIATFTITPTAATQPVLVRGVNTLGVAGLAVSAVIPAGGAVSLTIPAVQATPPSGPYTGLSVAWVATGMPAGTTFDVSYNNGGANTDSQTGLTASPAVFSGVTFNGSPGTGAVTVIAQMPNGSVTKVRNKVYVS